MLQAHKLNGRSIGQFPDLLELCTHCMLFQMTHVRFWGQDESTTRKYNIMNGYVPKLFESINLREQFPAPAEYVPD